MAPQAHFDNVLAAETDAVISASLDSVQHGTPRIHHEGEACHVVVVAAPAGAGKSYLVRRAVRTLLAAANYEPFTVVLIAPTNEQVFDLVADLAAELARTSATIGYLPARSADVPSRVTSAPGVTMLNGAADVVRSRPTVLVATAAKAGDARWRRDRRTGLTALRAGMFAFLLLDEAYQADAGLYLNIADLAPRHMLVGDPGQLDPFSTMPDPDRWRGLPEDPLQTAVGVVTRNWGSAVETFRLQITRRLPPSAIPVVASFYPEVTLGAWTLPGTRAATPQVRATAGPVAAAVTGACTDGWAHLVAPARVTHVADGEIADLVAASAAELLARDIVLQSESGVPHRLDVLPASGPSGVGIVVSHNSQREAVAARLAGTPAARVPVLTANKAQGLQFETTVIWHPLAGSLTSDEFHVDPGRLCVMLSRHRHGCIVVGRTGDGDVLGSVPPPSPAWAGYAADPVLDGWFAHRGVWDGLAAFRVPA